MIRFKDFITASNVDNEVVCEMKHLVGTCVNSFDADGNTTVGSLPWSHVSDFARANEKATHISKDDFVKGASVPHSMHRKLTNPKTQYMKTHDGVHMMYDPNEDRHYFFTK